MEIPGVLDMINQARRKVSSSQEGQLPVGMENPEHRIEVVVYGDGLNRVGRRIVPAPMFYRILEDRWGNKDVDCTLGYKLDRKHFDSHPFAGATLKDFLKMHRGSRFVEEFREQGEVDFRSEVKISEPGDDTEYDLAMKIGTKTAYMEEWFILRRANG